MPNRLLYTPFLWFSLLGCFAATSAQEKGGTISPLKDRAQAHDEETLLSAGYKTDGESLLSFFRKRTLTDAERVRLETLVRELGDDRFTTRENASMELSQAGPLVAPMLRAALKDPDLEIVKRAQRCLEHIDSSRELPLGLSAARLLADRKPAGAVEVILEFIYFVADPLLEEELLKSLTTLALDKTKVDEVVVKALTSKIAAKRAAAAYVVAQSPLASQREKVLGLINDTDPGVRFQAAQGLLLVKDARALPVLVKLLSDGPIQRSWQCEELLFVIAGERSPSAYLGAGDQATRAKVRKAWQDWLEREGHKIDLNRLDLNTKTLGLTLCIAWDSEKHPKGRVFEVDADGKEKWSITDVEHPVDGHVLRRGDRVLIAEQSAMRVTERDFTGKIFWEYKVTENEKLVSCRRLANGNTWIVTYNKTMEVQPDGKPLYTREIEPGWLTDAAKLRNGNISYLTYSGNLVEIDPQGSEIRRIKIEAGTSGLTKFEQLPNRNYLVVQQSSGKVQELDALGKVVWEYAMISVNAAKQLSNGNILLTSFSTRKVVEITRAGVVVWEYKPGAGLLSCSRR